MLRAAPATLVVGLRALAHLAPAIPQPPSLTIVDCGASHHLSGDPGILRGFVSDVSVPVGGIDDLSNMRATGVARGSVDIGDVRVPLSMVYFVPGLTTTLISMSALQADGCGFVIAPSPCDTMSVTTPGGSTIVLPCRDGLYPCTPDSLHTVGAYVARAVLPPPTGEAVLWERSVSPSSVWGFVVTPSGLLSNTSTDGIGRANLWHYRLGHVSLGNAHFRRHLELAVGHKLRWSGARCDGCALAKMKAKFRRAPRVRPATRPLQRVHFDVCPSVPVVGHGGFNGFLLLIDEFTEMWFLFLTRSKTEIPGILRDFKVFAEKHFRIRMVGLACRPFELTGLRSDGEAVNTSAIVSAWCNEHGITQEVSSAYCQWQNGLLERAMQTLWDCSEAMRKAYRAPKFMWTWSLKAFVYIYVRITTNPDGVCPWELWNDVRVPLLERIHHMRVLFCLCYVLVPKEKRRRLDDKSVACVFVGYSARSKAYVAMEVGTTVLHESPNMIFDEAVKPFDRHSSSTTHDDTDADFGSMDFADLGSVASVPLPIDTSSPPAGVASSSDYIPDSTAADASSSSGYIPDSTGADESSSSGYIPGFTDAGASSPSGHVPVSAGAGLSSSSSCVPAPEPPLPPGPWRPPSLSVPSGPWRPPALSSLDGPWPEMDMPALSPTVASAHAPSESSSASPTASPPLSPRPQRRRRGPLKFTPEPWTDGSRAVHRRTRPHTPSPPLSPASSAGSFDFDLPASGAERVSPALSAASADVLQSLYRAADPTPSAFCASFRPNGEVVVPRGAAAAAALCRMRTRVASGLSTADLVRVQRRIDLIALAAQAPVLPPYMGGVAPTSVPEALSGVNGPAWAKAMALEMGAMDQYGVWTLVELPPGRKALGSKWVLTIKRDQAGFITKLKCRLTLKGYNQVHGRDFHETFAPTGNLRVFRFMLAEAAADASIFVMQWDVTSAFLHAAMDCDVYMAQPDGFVVPGQEHLVCRLLKALYGSRQASRLFHEMVRDHLLSLNKHDGVSVVQSSVDECFFVIRRGSDWVKLDTHVDDFCVSSNSRPFYAYVFQHMTTAFDITDYGGALIKHFLGVGVTKMEDGSYELNQTAYIVDLLDRLDLTNSAGYAHGALSPERPGAPGKLRALSSPLSAADAAFMVAVPYRSSVGALFYLSRLTRPDIAHAAQQVARFVDNPSPVHWAAVLRIYSFLSATRLTPLRYSTTSLAASSALCGGLDVRLMAFSDADWAGCQDTRRSTTGWLIRLGGSTVAWRTILQGGTAQSSTEAEYVSASAASNELVWWRQLLMDAGYPLQSASPILCDNKACRSLADHACNFNAFKHIEIAHHVLRERQAKKLTLVDWVPGERQWADLLTKNLSVKLFRKMACIILNVAVFLPHHSGKAAGCDAPRAPSQLAVM